MRNLNTERSLRRYQVLGFASVIVMAGAFGGWAALASINGAVVAPATIMVESYSKKVQHKEGGIVREILVKDGDKVLQGQRLVVLDDTELAAHLAIIDAMLIENLAKQARLEAQRDDVAEISFAGELRERQKQPKVLRIIAGQSRLFHAIRSMVAGKTEQLAQQIAQLKQQIDGFDAQIVAKDEQLKIVAEELAANRKLLKLGGIEKTKVLSFEREAARLAGERGELLASRASCETKIGEVKLQIIQIKEEVLTRSLDELREVETKVSELHERKVAASSQLGRTFIKAPMAGDVYQVSVHTVGGVIAPGETLMLIVPRADELVLQAQVSPQDIDQVEAGQSAQVRFPTFNAQTTPSITATVVQISADTSRPDQNSSPYYGVRLSISEAELKKLAGNKLKPGMPAEAFIQTDPRTPISYFLKPLSDQIQHAFREG